MVVQKRLLLYLHTLRKTTGDQEPIKTMSGCMVMMVGSAFSWYERQQDFVAYHQWSHSI